jgi:diguanylate cyclase (GGDEF)-like protein
MPDHHETAPIRLEQFLYWLTPVLFGFALMYGGMGVIFGDLPTQICAVVIAAVAASLLVARRAARQLDIRRAIIIFMSCFFIAVPILTFLQPGLATSHAVVPLVVALVVLQYDPDPLDHITMGLCSIVTALVVLIGSWSPITSQIPDIVLTGLRLSTLIANLVCALLLVRQLRQQLIVTLIETQTAHSALAIAHQELRNRARLDTLTGLFHRGALEEISATIIPHSMQTKTSLGIVMLDLDHFKRINDTFGHGAGDLVLCTIADTLRATLRSSDLAFRYGGEEFVVLLSAIGQEDIVQRIDQLRGRVSALQLEYGGQHLGQVTLSAGVALCPQHGHSLDRLIQAADHAMYMAKRSGRNRVCVAGSEI